MLPYQHAFIECCLQRDILKFGEFTLKSGRVSPYFFNAGLFNDGQVLQAVGGFYAQTLLAHDLKFDVLFGPAYKGIPLVCATAMQLAAESRHPVPYAFNRKVAKDHGEGGNLVGTSLKDQQVLVVDDVITAGTAFREAKSLIEAAGGHVCGLIVALDRQEKGQGSLSAIEEITDSTGVPVYSIVTLGDVLQFVQADPKRQATRDAIEAYRATYGSATIK